MQLVEEAIDTSVVGHRDRMSVQNSEIGSVYSPPSTQQPSDTSVPSTTGYVETVIEVDYRAKVHHITIRSQTIH